MARDSAQGFDTEASESFKLRIIRQRQRLLRWQLRWLKRERQEDREWILSDIEDFIAKF